MRTADENQRAQVACDMAYIELPSRAHADVRELRAEFEDAPDVAAVRYFLRAAKSRAVKANPDDLRCLRAHVGELDGRRDVIVIEYPRFPAEDLLTGATFDLPAVARDYVLAPYFSAVAFDRDTREANCFVLGQSLDANTQLRVVTPALNMNLGPGCVPELRAFLKLVRKHGNRSWDDE
jgi:hypothetical protein